VSSHAARCPGRSDRAAAVTGAKPAAAAYGPAKRRGQTAAYDPSCLVPRERRSDGVTDHPEPSPAAGRGHAPTVGAEGGRGNWPLVAKRRADLLTCFRIPHLRGAVRKSLRWGFRVLCLLHQFNYQGAYQLWGTSYQGSHPYAQFANGYANTKHDDYVFQGITPLADGTVKVGITFYATEQDTSGTSIQGFKGSYVVGKENGNWRILTTTNIVLLGTITQLTPSQQDQALAQGVVQKYYDDINQTDYSSYLTKARNTDANVLVFCNYGPDTQNSAKAAIQLGLNQGSHLHAIDPKPFYISGNVGVVQPPIGDSRVLEIGGVQPCVGEISVVESLSPEILPFGRCHLKHS